MIRRRGGGVEHRVFLASSAVRCLIRLLLVCRSGRRPPEFVNLPVRLSPAAFFQSQGLAPLRRAGGGAGIVPPHFSRTARACPTATDAQAHLYALRVQRFPLPQLFSRPSPGENRSGTTPSPCRRRTLSPYGLGKVATPPCDGEKGGAKDRCLSPSILK